MMRVRQPVPHRHATAVRLITLIVVASLNTALIALPYLGSQTVRSSAPPATSGQWSPLMNWPLVAVHMKLLPTGTVLMWDAWDGDGASARLWDPGSQGFVAVPEALSHIFCAGQVGLADGRLFIIGGHQDAGTGIPDSDLFDPLTNTWTATASMHVARWYPSATLLGDGRVLALGGEITTGVYADIPELYDPATDTWSQLSGAQRNVNEYPQVYAQPNGQVFLSAGPDGLSRTLDIAGQQWTTVGANPVPTGTTAMYRPGKVIAAGGETNGSDPVSSSTAVIDLNQPAPTWRQTSPLTFARDLHNLVLLPDGKVLAVGGSTVSSLTSTTGQLAAEMWDPATEAWTTMAAMQDLRLYHSTALLLPDGRVLVAGGGRLAPATDYLTAQIYSPPYLFQGTRPTITTAPTTLTYGAAITVQTPDAASIAAVSLIRLSSVTHAFNMDQRFLPLAFTAAAGTVTVQTPANANLAPPGDYMLFIVNANGVPSVAKIMQVVAHPASVTLTAPSSGTSVAGTAVTLGATATDDVGVASLQFLLDGVPLGASIPHAPYTAVWDTTTVANGAHIVTAQVRDTLGNVITSPPPTLTVANIVPPTIATITPAYGSPPGGNLVTITGTGFQGGATVTFGELGGTTVTVVNRGTLTVAAPAHGAGTVPVTVTNPDGGSVTLTGGYSYGVLNMLPTPQPSAVPGSVSPNLLPSGQRSGAAGGSGGLPAPQPPRR